MEKVDTLSNLITTLYQKKTSDATTEVAGEDNDRREEQLAKLNNTTEQIRDILKKRIAGAATENSVGFTTAPIKEIVTRVAEAIENVSGDELEKLSEENKKLITEFKQSLEKLSDKNSKEFLRAYEALMETADKLSKSDNETVRSLGEDTKGKLADRKLAEAGYELRGENDTFKNRLKRAFATEDQVDPVTGVAKIGGFKGLAKNIFAPKEGGLIDDLLTSDEEKVAREQRREERKIARQEKLDNITRPPVEAQARVREPIKRIADLTDEDRKVLEKQGYMQQGIGIVGATPGDSAKALSIDEINDRLANPDSYENRGEGSPTPSAEIETPKPIISSEDAEIASGLFEDPTKVYQEKIAENSDKQVELLGEILETLNKLGQVSESGQQPAGDSGGGGFGIPGMGNLARGAGRFISRGASALGRGAVGLGRGLVNAARGGANLVRGAVGLSAAGATGAGIAGAAGATGAAGAAGSAGASMGSRLASGAATVGKGALRVAGKLAAPIAIGMAAYDAYQGFNADPNATTGQALQNAGRNALSGLTFGLVSSTEDKMADGSYQTDRLIEKAEDEGLYDKDYIGNSEIDKTKLAETKDIEMLNAILADNDMNEEDTQAVKSRIEQIQSGVDLSPQESKDKEKEKEKKKSSGGVMSTIGKGLMAATPLGIAGMAADKLTGGALGSAASSMSSLASAAFTATPMGMAAEKLGLLSSAAEESSIPNINVPPPTVISQGGDSGIQQVAETLAQLGGMKSVRANDSSWMRFQDRRSFG